MMAARHFRHLEAVPIHDTNAGGGGEGGEEGWGEQNYVPT